MMTELEIKNCEPHKRNNISSTEPKYTIEYDNLINGQVNDLPP